MTGERNKVMPTGGLKKRHRKSEKKGEILNQIHLYLSSRDQISFSLSLISSLTFLWRRIIAQSTKNN